MMRDRLDSNSYYSKMSFSCCFFCGGRIGLEGRGEKMLYMLYSIAFSPDCEFNYIFD